MSLLSELAFREFREVNSNPKSDLRDIIESARRISMAHYVDKLADLLGVDSALASSQDDSVSLAPSNSASQYGASNLSRILYPVREWSPPYVDRPPKRIRLHTDNINAAESALSANSLNPGFFDSDHSLDTFWNLVSDTVEMDGMQADASLPAPAQLAGDLSPFVPTQSTPIPSTTVTVFGSTPVLASEPTTSRPIALAPTGQWPEDADDNYILPSVKNQKLGLKKVEHGDGWRFWTKYQAVRYLGNRLRVALTGDRRQGLVEICQEVNRNVLFGKRSEGGVRSMFSTLREQYTSICEFRSYLEEHGLGDGLNYYSNPPETAMVNLIREWITSAQNDGVMLRISPRDYYAWTYGGDESMFALIHQASECHDNRSGQRPTGTPHNPPNPRTRRPMPFPRPSDLGYRETKQFADDDEDSNNNPTEVSSAIPSNPDSGVSRPLTAGGTPPTSALRGINRPPMRSSTLANSTNNSALQGSVIDAIEDLRSEIRSMRDDYSKTEQKRTDLIDLDNRKKRRLVLLKKAEKMYHAQVDKELAVARENRKQAIEILASPHATPDAIANANKALEKKWPDLKPHAEDRAGIDAYYNWLVSREADNDDEGSGDDDESSGADEQTHAVGLNNPSPIPVQSTHSAPGPLIQTAVPSSSGSQPTRQGHGTTKPSLLRSATATSRAAAAASSSTPVATPFSASSARVSDWVVHQGDGSTA
ncbi:hypothetical protein FRC11_001990 [Ceratobasidium sp. 423]|nr:hypothetical protein FRC11_001990 [Ceratobasidium sp. 423]